MSVRRPLPDNLSARWCLNDNLLVRKPGTDFASLMGPNWQYFS